MDTSNGLKVKQTLDLVVSICLICVSVTFVLVAIRYWKNSRSDITTKENRPSYGSLQKGETLELASVRKHDPSGRLLLVALQSGCHFCRESIPLYKELLSHSNQLNAKMVFVFAEPLSSARAYLDEHGFSGVDLEQADFNSIHVAGTPTLILVDSDNWVVDYWIGKLQDAGVADLYHNLGARN